MHLETPQAFIISLLTLSIALIYSTVGHGGASGYIALLTLFSLPSKEVSSTALILNLVVSGTATFFFFRAGYFNKSLLWPLVITSIPAAFIGGLMKISGREYDIILFIALSIAAFKLLTDKSSDSTVKKSIVKPNIWLLFAIGAILGLISGMVGVGGGIFLSPLILFLGWANPKQVAAISAPFIFLNSFSGIFGRLSGGNFVFTQFDIILVLAVIIGSQIGARLGAFKFSNVSLKRLLGFVLLLANLKLFLSFFK